MDEACRAVTGGSSPRCRRLMNAMASAALDEVRGAFPRAWRALPAGRVSGRTDPFVLGATYFALQSRLALRRGEADRALASSLDAIELGGNACRGGGVEARFVGQICQETGLEEAERLYCFLPRTGLAAQLGRVRRIRISWPTIAETLEVERRQARVRCAAFLHGLGRLTLWQQLEASESAIDPSARPAAGSTPGGVRTYGWATLRQALTPRTTVLGELEQDYRALIAASSRPAPQGVKVSQPENPWVAQFTCRSFTGQYRGEWPRNNLCLLETALAVRLHFLAHGRYPTRLEEISPEWLPDHPRDVWDQPVAYRLKKGQPVVYSLGADGRDEGGRAVEPASLLQGKPGDLVFGKLARSHWEESVER
jgi:hypothetical protein